MSNQFIETPGFKSLLQRSFIYIHAGYAVHFRGPAGTGKTALALHLAELLGRPVILLHGNDEYKPSDLVGGNYGIRKKRVVDNYIHNVWKAEENYDQIWSDGRLTTACRMGYTLVYDEFNRSRPETNNVLLSILQEGILDLSTYQKEQEPIKVHPDFALIFTSNPQEYAGVHPFQDALRDRMITLNLFSIDSEAEATIVSVRSGLPRREAKRIVDIIRAIRGEENPNPSIRASLMTANVLALQGSLPISDNPFFLTLLEDVLCSENQGGDPSALPQRINEVVWRFTHRDNIDS